VPTPFTYIQPCYPSHAVANHELQSPCTAEVEAASLLWLLNDFSGVCSDLAPISSSFYSVSAWHSLVGFLSRSDPVDLTLLMFMDTCCVWNHDPWTFTTKFSLTVSSRTSFHI
jgi:hypothetical protein